MLVISMTLKVIDKIIIKHKLNLEINWAVLCKKKKKKTKPFVMPLEADF